MRIDLNFVLPRLFLLTPNFLEFVEMANKLKLTNLTADTLQSQNEQIQDLMRQFLENGPQIVIVKLGEKGLFLGIKHTKEIKYYEPPEVSQIISVNGAGDTFLGTLISSLFRFEPNSFHEAKISIEMLSYSINLAQRASSLTLSSPHPVSPFISQHLELL